MGEYQDVFKRYEKKYLLTNNQYRQLREQLNNYTNEDDYGVHTINNIYYDTNDYQLIRESLAKPVYKQKLRLRSYGTPTKDSNVFVEIKKKYKGVVYKRRVSMELSKAEAYLQNEIIWNNKTQIINEIDWLLKSYDLSPKAFIGYDRIALYGKEDEQLRITFDTNIRFRDEHLDLTKGSDGTQLLQPNEVLMEIKVPQVLPLWLCHILTQLQIHSHSFSKYGTCFTTYLNQTFIQNLDPTITNIQTGGINCA